MKRRLSIVAVVVLVAVWLWLRHSDTSATTPVATRSVDAAPAPVAHDAPTVPLQTATVGAPKVDAAAAQPPATPATDAGTSPALFGKLVALGQEYSFAEALQKNAADADALVDKFCDRAASLKKKSPLQPPKTREHDAAAFLAPLVDYEKPFDQPYGALHLSDELKEHLTAGAGTDWGAKITAADLAALDFSWLTTLQQFDHWSYLGAGRLRGQKSGDAFNAAIPNYVSLQQWAKLRFALARRRGDFGAASREVRHLAELVSTQGVLIADMIAVAIYGIEASARAAAVAAGRDVTDWDPPDRAALEPRRPLEFASMYFAYPGVKPETLRRAMACAPAPCVAITEGITTNRAFASYATDNTALLRELAQSNGCEPALIDFVAQQRELNGPEAHEMLGTDVADALRSRLDPL